MSSEEEVSDLRVGLSRQSPCQVVVEWKYPERNHVQFWFGVCSKTCIKGPWTESNLIILSSIKSAF